MGEQQLDNPYSICIQWGLIGKDVEENMPSLCVEMVGVDP